MLHSKGPRELLTLDPPRVIVPGQHTGPWTTERLQGSTLRHHGGVPGPSDGTLCDQCPPPPLFERLATPLISFTIT